MNILDYFPKTAKIHTPRPTQLELLPQIEAKLKSGSKKIIIVMPTGGGKCLYIGSNIHTSMGIKYPNDLNTDDGVVGYNTDLNKIESAKISTRSQNELKNVLKIITRQGYELICTPEHKILIFDGMFKWKEAKDINQFDCIPINRTIPTIKKNCDLILPNYIKSKYSSNINETISEKLPINITEELAYFLGLVIGNGSIEQNCIRITYNIQDTDLIDFSIKYSNNLSLNPYIYKKKNANSITVSFNSVILLNWLSTNGFKKLTSITKVVPYFILNSSKEIQCAFLRGLFDTDGHVSSKNIEYSTSSRILGEQVQQLLLVNGIISHRIDRITKCNGKPFKSWRLTIGSTDAKLYYKLIGFGAIRRQKDLIKLICKISNPNVDVIPFIQPYLLNLHKELTKASIYKEGAASNRKFNLTRFAEDCILYGTTHKSVAAYRQQSGNRNPSYSQLNKLLLLYEPISYCPEYKFLKSLNESHLFFDTIRSIDILSEKQYVCDLEVPLTHSFVANGFIVHNSAISHTTLNYFTHENNCKGIYTSPLNSLVDQVHESFYELGVRTLKGRNRYPCKAKNMQSNCDEGHCQSEICQYHKRKDDIRDCKNNPYNECVYCACKSCIYKAVKAQFQASKIANTNFTMYSFGMTNQDKDRDENKLSKDFITIVDEADVLEDTIRNDKTVKIKESWGKQTWQDYLALLHEHYNELELISEDDNGKPIRKIVSKMKAIKTLLDDYDIHKEEWNPRIERDSIIFEPVTVTRFIEPMFKDKTVIMMSATPDKLYGWDIIEVGSEIPFWAVPWQYKPLGKMTLDDGIYEGSHREKTIPKICEFINDLEGKTLVHCNSYQTALKMAECLRSNHGTYALLQTRDNYTFDNYDLNSESRYEIIRAFKSAKDKNKIALTVNMGRGIDCPEPEICNSVIACMPQFNPTDSLVKAKIKLLGHGWMDRAKSNDIMQEDSRIKRGIIKFKDVIKQRPDLDWLPQRDGLVVKKSWILDSNFNSGSIAQHGKFFDSNKKLFYKWFLDRQQ